MAYNEHLAERIRQALAHVPNVKEQKMFGGLAFMVNGKMCVTVGPARIMCRIDPALHEDAVQKKGVSTVIMGGRTYKGYVHVTEDEVKTSKALAYWIGLALDYNKTAKASKK
jgi:TfoX/Sxy family transcriptional regulator of competence genes